MIGKKIANKFKSEKILSFNNSVKKIQELKKQGKTIGLCHGGFDLLHPGQMIHLESAKKLCDILFVSITADKFVTTRKGSGRPVFPDELRAYSVASMEFVDYVVITNFKKAVEILEQLKPSYYIKGPDFIKKNTPGIMSERAKIKEIGGEMKYTDDPKLGTTEIIKYIKEELHTDKILVGIDRDGTLVTSNDFLGKNKNWKKDINLNKPVIDFLIYLQTKYETSFIVVTNQAGVARKYFDLDTLEKINKHIDDMLKGKKIEILNWQSCPDVDADYAKLMKDKIEFDPKFIKKKTKRKPNTDMLYDGLKAINKEIGDFDKVIIVGDRHEDKELADNLKAKFIDVNDKNYNDLVKESGL